MVCTTEESGEHVIAGCGELHVEICLKDLKLVLLTELVFHPVPGEGRFLTLLLTCRLGCLVKKQWIGGAGGFWFVL